MIFDSLAFLLTPADRGRSCRVVEAEAGWRFDPASAVGTDVLIWGRGPATSGTSWINLARGAAARELTIRTLRWRVPAPIALIGIHPLPPPELLPGHFINRLRALALGGAIVELAGEPRIPRVVDVVAGAAGVEGRVTSLSAGSGGALLARVVGPRGERLILRAAREGQSGDPLRGHEALERLAELGVPLAPRPAGSGVTAGASWTTESALPGNRPERVTPHLIADVTEMTLAFPRSSDPPAAPSEHLRAIERAFPRWSKAIASLGRRVGATLATLPSVLAHGDLWAGNLLVEGGRLTGLIDWDAWHSQAAPGSDLLHLVATELRYRARRSFGAAVVARPWRSSAFASASAPYWHGLGVMPDADALDGVGISWWAGQVANSLGRMPELATDDLWVRDNVDRVLSRITDWGGA